MEKHNPYLTKEIMNELRHGAATAITGHYYDMVAEIVSVVSVQNKPVFSDSTFILKLSTLIRLFAMLRLRRQNLHSRD